MEEMQQITLDQWLAWKEDIRQKLQETAGNFVHIGFRLKQIRDSGMLDGAANIFEFALKEYGLSKSSTSRFIAINEKFSEGGNSLELKEEYRAIGSSKLAEMLTLTDAECSLITERTTVNEIRELKNFSRQQVPALESGAGDPGGAAQALTPLQKCLTDYFRDKKEMLNGIIAAIRNVDYKAAVELMNPSGYGTHKKGLCFMFMYDYNTGVKIKYLTAPEPETMEWASVLLEVYAIYADITEAGEADVHGAYYGGDEETAESQNAAGSAGASVATSQRKPEKREKVENAGIVEPVEEPVEEAAKEAAGVPEEQKPAEKPEINVTEVKETAENQGEEDNSVATSQREEDRDTTEDDEPEERACIPNGAAVWDEILASEIFLTNFVSEYTRADAATGDISMKKIKNAYKSAIDLAAAIETLMILYAKEDGEDE
ncbi:MAG: hypothetical protein NC123_15605 [Butyrivibrio sp.]|nr:hypothetical protein [Acetatifactor muris]MCM1560945.1 hypothetical protein [Butyrivibrio sp.]